MPDAAPERHIHSVRGVVVHVRFNAGAPPALNDAPAAWERTGPRILEVLNNPDLTTLRAVALPTTAGLVRGVAVRATGAPVMVPVGLAELGRLPDITGTPRDLGDARPEGTPPRSIHTAGTPPFRNCCAAAYVHRRSDMSEPVHGYGID